MNQVLSVVLDLPASGQSSRAQFWDGAATWQIRDVVSDSDEELAFLLNALFRAEAQQRRLIAQAKESACAVARAFYEPAIAKVSALITEIEHCIETTARRTDAVSALAA